MADIKWIKITTDIFDDEKIVLIESMPEADSLIVIWFKLLSFAGKSNNNGVFMLSEKIPYTDEMLATIFRRPLNTVRLALQTFEQFGMIEYINGIINIANWEKHQNIDGLDKIREQNRLRKQAQRERKKLLSLPENNSSRDSHGTVTQSHAIEEDKEEEQEEEQEKDEDKEKREKKQDIDYQLIADKFNKYCPSFPKIRALSDARKKAIKARLNSGYSVDDFEELFEMAENSDFLKGKNDKNWQATFDWLIKDANMAKVLDGNYRNKGKEKADNPFANLKGVTTL